MNEKQNNENRNGASAAMEAATDDSPRIMALLPNAIAMARPIRPAETKTLEMFIVRSNLVRRSMAGTGHISDTEELRL